jgi:hypothetical protein
MYYGKIILKKEEKLLHLTLPRVPSALVMQGWMDVGHMGCSSIVVRMFDIHASIDIFRPSSNEPFLCQNVISNQTVVPYGDHGTERVMVHHSNEWTTYICSVAFRGRECVNWLSFCIVGPFWA